MNAKYQIAGTVPNEAHMTNKYADQLRDNIGKIVAALVAAGVGAIFTLLLSLSIDSGRHGVLLDTIAARLDNFATKAELRLVEQKIDSHLDEYKEIRKRIAQREAQHTQHSK